MMGCAPPAKKYATAAHNANFQDDTIQGTRFRHKIYRNNLALRGGILHVFIEGDASVKQALRSAPPDPTPRQLLMLGLMRQHNAGAIVLGRPCYHGMFTADKCEVRHLGPERYSADSVSSMIAALQKEMNRAHAKQVIIFGYSGGGTLAMLMAAQYPAVAALVTLAGNLDNATLTAYHNAPALSGSLNPADLPALPASVVQVHFFGAKDEITPAFLAQKTLARQKASAIILQRIDHECCWHEVWPDILAKLQTAMELTGPTAKGAVP